MNETNKCHPNFTDVLERHQHLADTKRIEDVPSISVEARSDSTRHEFDSTRVCEYRGRCIEPLRAVRCKVVRGDTPIGDDDRDGVEDEGNQKCTEHQKKR